MVNKVNVVNNHSIFDDLLEKENVTDIPVNNIYEWWEQTIESFIDVMSMALPDSLVDKDDVTGHNCNALCEALSELVAKHEKAKLILPNSIVDETKPTLAKWWEINLEEYIDIMAPSLPERLRIGLSVEQSVRQSMDDCRMAMLRLRFKINEYKNGKLK